MRAYLANEERHDLTLRLEFEMIDEELHPPTPPSERE